MFGIRQLIPGRKKRQIAGQLSGTTDDPGVNVPPIGVGHAKGEEPDHIFEEGIKFHSIPSSFRQIFEVSEYWFDDIIPEDAVVDIGANVGAFCIRAARQARKITAVEPVTAAILRRNIALNNVSVEVIEGALGIGDQKEICWDSQSAAVQTYPLREIIRLAGGCTFLKCDCEGAEWLINPADLDGIRRIEMELHLPPICDPPRSEFLEYIGQHYDFEIERRPVHSPLGVMGILHAVRR